MENDLDTIMGMVEEPHPPDLIENGIIGVISHVVRRYRRKRVAFKCEYAPLEKDNVLCGQEFF